MSDRKEPKVQQLRSIVLDFDGTVTESDLFDRIALEFGDPAVYQEVEDGLDAGTMPLREVITREFAPVTAPLDEVVAWSSSELAIRAGLPRFVDAAQAAGWEVHVVSSGFHEMIEPVLEREGVRSSSTRTGSTPGPTAGGSCGATRTPAPSAAILQARALLPDGSSSTSATATPTAAPRSPPTASSRPRGLAATSPSSGDPFEPFETSTPSARRSRST